MQRAPGVHHSRCAPAGRRSRHNRTVGGHERFEQLIAFLGSQLPTPVDQQTAGDGTMVFTGGAPAEVVVSLADSNVIVSEYAGVWESPNRFVVRPRRVGLLKWRRLPETAIMNALSSLIKGAREMRLSRYRPCTVCGAKNPPEALFGDDVCYSCEEPPQTVVH
jgi:hypothetical protein